MRRVACPTGVRVGWQGNALPHFFLTPPKMPVFLSPFYTHTLIWMLYWLVFLSCRIQINISGWTRSQAKVSQWLQQHTLYIYCGGVMWVAHWLVSKYMSHWKCGCSFIWVHLCQSHCRGRKRKGHICMTH